MPVSRAAVEPIHTLDEKFIASPLAFEVMRPATTVIVDGETLRTEDGRIDRDLVRTVVIEALRVVPEFRQRLRPAWLGLATPVWMPPGPAADVDLGYHVRFHPEAVSLAESWDVLTGRHNGSMERDRPLWDLLVVDLDDGRVGLALRASHVLGDGVFLMRVIEGFFGMRPGQVPGGAPTGDPARAPSTSFGVLVASARSWLAQQDSWRGAWHEYWRKPVSDRVRRWGGRLLRPARFARFRREQAVRNTLPPWHSVSRTVDTAIVREHAKALGGSVTAVTVAAALRAAATVCPPQDDETAMLVPISSPVRGPGGKRNDVQVARVGVNAKAPLPEVVGSVTEQVNRAAASGASGITRGRHDWVGYVSFLPIRRPARAFGPARVESLTLWPVLDPQDAVAVFASTNGDRFTVAVTASAGIDVDAVLGSVLGTLGVGAEVAS